jgi:hypothetical protein
LYFRRELALAQSLFDRFLAAIDPLPLGLVVASVGGLFYSAGRITIASTASQPTTTKETTAPAVILAFSFAVYGRIQRLSWRPLSLEGGRKIGHFPFITINRRIDL